MTDDQDPQIEVLPSGAKIAYREFIGSQSPGVVLLNGFMGFMKHERAFALQKFCQDCDISFIRFDYSGISESPGDFMDATLTLWFESVLHVIDKLTSGPQIIVGYSLGAIFGLLATEARPERVCACVMVSTALNLRSFLEVARPHPENSKICFLDGIEDGEVPFALVKEIPNFDLYERVKLGKLNVSCPVRFLHGAKDSIVPFQSTVDILDMLKSEDVNLTIIKNADHPFSNKESLEIVFKSLKELLDLVNPNGTTLKNENSC